MTLEELVDYLIRNDKRVDAQVNICDTQFLARVYYVRSDIRIDLLPIYPSHVLREKV